MTDKIKISELPEASSITDDDYLVIDNGTNTKKVKAPKGKDYFVPSDVLQETDVINNTESTATNHPLSANMGKSLQDQVNNLKNLGRFLAIWDCSTGLPLSEPEEMPYEYHTGDYFRVGTIGETNYKPSGTEYDGTASTVEETEDVQVGWVYYFDGTNWRAQSTGGEGLVQDVQINGESIVDTDEGVANIEDVVFVGNEIAEETEPVDADLLGGTPASGFVKKTEVNHTYNPSSQDPQSGLAVEQAVGDKLKISGANRTLNVNGLTFTDGTNTFTITVS